MLRIAITGSMASRTSNTSSRRSLVKSVTIVPFRGYTYTKSSFSNRRIASRTGVLLTFSSCCSVSSDKSLNGGYSPEIIFPFMYSYAISVLPKIPSSLIHRPNFPRSSDISVVYILTLFLHFVK